MFSLTVNASLQWGCFRALDKPRASYQQYSTEIQDLPLTFESILDRLGCIRRCYKKYLEHIRIQSGNGDWPVKRHPKNSYGSCRTHIGKGINTVVALWKIGVLQEPRHRQKDKHFSCFLKRKGFVGPTLFWLMSLFICCCFLTKENTILLTRSCSGVCHEKIPRSSWDMSILVCLWVL